MTVVIGNDEFNPTAKTWAWMSGSSTRNAIGTYGTQGVGSTLNVPGSRANGVSWIDSSGNLWLFGGFYIDPSNGKVVHLNDLWLYTP